MGDGQDRPVGHRDQQPRPHIPSGRGERPNLRDGGPGALRSDKTIDPVASARGMLPHGRALESAPLGELADRIHNFVGALGRLERPLRRDEAARIAPLVTAVDVEVRRKLADPLRGRDLGSLAYERQGPWRYSSEQEQAQLARGLDPDRVRTERMYQQLHHIGPLSAIVFGIQLLRGATAEEAFDAADRARLADELLKAGGKINEGQRRFEGVGTNALRTSRQGGGSTSAPDMGRR